MIRLISHVLKSDCATQLLRYTLIVNCIGHITALIVTPFARLAANHTGERRLTMVIIIWDTWIELNWDSNLSQPAVQEGTHFKSSGEKFWWEEQLGARMLPFALIPETRPQFQDPRTHSLISEKNKFFPIMAVLATKKGVDRNVEGTSWAMPFLPKKKPPQTLWKWVPF